MLIDLFSVSQAYLDGGSKYSKQMDYQNFVHKPLITGEYTQQVLDIINLPSLHMLLGVTDNIIKAIERSVFESELEGQMWMDNYLNTVIFVSRNKKQQRSALEGNQARKFIASVGLLEQQLANHSEEALMKATPMIQVGKAFHKVIESYMGMDLMPNWRDTIDHFTLIYRQSDMSITPKVSNIKCFPKKQTICFRYTWLCTT